MRSFSSSLLPMNGAANEVTNASKPRDRSVSRDSSIFSSIDNARFTQDLIDSGLVDHFEGVS